MRYGTDEVSGLCIRVIVVSMVAQIRAKTSSELQVIRRCLVIHASMLERW